jgi:hypothetical protein
VGTTAQLKRLILIRMVYVSGESRVTDPDLNMILRVFNLRGITQVLRAKPKRGFESSTRPGGLACGKSAVSAHPQTFVVNLRLRASDLPFWVDVRLRSFGDRWIAVVEIVDEMDLGVGLSAREALTAALSPLGQRATLALLSDPQLLSAFKTAMKDPAPDGSSRYAEALGCFSNEDPALPRLLAAGQTRPH